MLASFTVMEKMFAKYEGPILNQEKFEIIFSNKQIKTKTMNI